MQIKFWGVRGSFPYTFDPDQWKQQLISVLSQFMKTKPSSIDDVERFVQLQNLPELIGYGSATTCVQVSDGDNYLIIDGGSGIKNFSDRINFNGPQKIHILLTHFHFDHIMGLPFFLPHFLPHCEVHYYSVQSETEKIVRDLFHKPVFPVSYESLKAKIYFHQLSCYENYNVNGFDVTAYKLDHPDPCYGYKITKNGKSYSHAVDHEAERMDQTSLGKDAELFQNTNLLYIDSQFSDSDMPDKKGWGHGTFQKSFELAERFEIPQLLLGHHDPGSGFEKMSELKKEIQLYANEKQLSFDWCLAHEGLIIDL